MQYTLNELETALQKRIEEMKLPGCSVCIRGPEGFYFEKVFGKRSIEQDLDVTPDTVFGIASMSKSFTALSCCILAAEGKMSLEDPITKYFPTLHLKGVPDELVTIRQIGLHRAGIPPMEPLEWSIAMNTPGRKSKAEEQLKKESPNQMDTIEQIVDYIAEGRYRTLGEPGEIMSYSNEGYAILSYVVDQAAGMPLEQFLMERIFRPLGMTRTILDQDCSELKAMVGDGNVTRLFETDDDGVLREDDSWSVLPPFRGCACIKSTAPDMARYYQMLSNRGVFEGKRIVPEEAIDLMFGPEYPLRRKPFNVMGLKKRSIAGKMVCDHGGGLANRVPGWPRILAVKNGKAQNPAMARTLPYFDAVFFARRIKGEAYLAVGLVDVTCSPTSIFAAYNAIPGKKHITVLPCNGHRNSVSKAFVRRLEKLLSGTAKSQ